MDTNDDDSDMGSGDHDFDDLASIGPSFSFTKSLSDAIVPPATPNLICLNSPEPAPHSPLPPLPPITDSATIPLNLLRSIRQLLRDANLSPGTLTGIETMLDIIHGQVSTLVKTVSSERAMVERLREELMLSHQNNISATIFPHHSVSHCNSTADSASLAFNAQDSSSSSGLSGAISGPSSSSLPQWNPQPSVDHSALCTLTFDDLQTHRLAKYTHQRQKFAGIAAQVVWSGPADVPGREAKKNNKSRHTVAECLQSFDGTPATEADGSPAYEDAVRIGKVLFVACVPPPPDRTSDKDITYGNKFFQAKHKMAFQGSLALLEALHPRLQLCGDHFKARHFFTKAFANLRREHKRLSDEMTPSTPASLPSAAATTHTSSHPPSPTLFDTQPSTHPSDPYNKGKHRETPAVPLPSRISLKRTAEDQSPSQASSRPLQRLRLEALHLDDGQRMDIDEPSADLLASPTTTPAESGEDSSMDELRRTAQRLKLGAQPLPSSAQRTRMLPSGRLVVDVSILRLPEPEFDSLASWLSTQTTAIPQFTIAQIKELVNDMARNTAPHDNPSSQITNQLIVALETADPNANEYDDDDNNDAQWGHAQFSGVWADAVSSWEDIGSTRAALRLLAGGIRMAEIAAFVCSQRHIQHSGSLLVYIYLEKMAEYISSAWNRVQPAPPTSSSPPAPTASAPLSSLAAAGPSSAPSVSAPPILTPILPSAPSTELPTSPAQGFAPTTSPQIEKLMKTLTSRNFRRDFLIAILAVALGQSEAEVSKQYAGRNVWSKQTLSEEISKLYHKHAAEIDKKITELKQTLKR